MTYDRFEELPVWQEAIRLAEGVYNMTENRRWKGSYSLRDQVERAALSVSNSIAEGFERGTTNELVGFYLYRPRIGRRGTLHALFSRTPPRFC